jgi:hypothetical protein
MCNRQIDPAVFNGLVKNCGSCEHGYYLSLHSVECKKHDMKLSSDYWCLDWKLWVVKND